MSFFENVLKKLSDLESKFSPLSHHELTKKAIENKEVFVSNNGALVQWTPAESTGRSPQDTYMVDHPEIHASIDWTSNNNLPIAIDCFDHLLKEALVRLESAKTVYITKRVVGADSRYALPVTTYTDTAVSALFTNNMFRPCPTDLQISLFSDQPFRLLALPRQMIPEELKPLRKDGKKSNMVIIMDFHRRIGLVFGSSYLGSIKKLMFTVMNHLLPGHGILPIHASANEGTNGDLALFLGLSGTGKTTLSADAERSLLGDDEHGWSEDGIANFENGCYAKLINLDPNKEPEIYHAITHSALPEVQRAIVENTMVYPDGHFDFNDIRLTENSRGSYPLSSLKNIKPSSMGGHPNTIIFLTADANGVLPPVAKLNTNQAMLWFIMGYTSKLAGTETGVKEPTTTFSRFFGAPFMPRLPQDYAQLLGQKLLKHQTQVFLVNTGWSGGPYGEGARISLPITRQIIRTILDGGAAELPYLEDERFHIMVPSRFPGVETRLLNPINTWQDAKAYEIRANRLAQEFSQHFDKAYGKQNLAQEICNACPGKRPTSA